MNKTDRNPCPHGSYILEWREGQTVRKKKRIKYAICYINKIGREGACRMFREGAASLNSEAGEGLTKATFKYKLLAVGFQVLRKVFSVQSHHHQASGP